MANPNIQRIVVAALSLSAAGLVGIIGSEGYTDKAIIPTKGDRPTVGFGSTFRDDGSPVKMGDTITPPNAIKRTLAHVQKSESGIKACVAAPLTQNEYDLMVNFSYQFGVPALCKSSIVKYANTGDYKKSCQSYLLYKYSGGHDCSIAGNKVCAGVWARQKERYQQCMEGL